MPYRCAKIKPFDWGINIVHKDNFILREFASLEGTGRHASNQFKDKNTILSKPNFKLCKGFVTGTGRLMLVMGQTSE